MRANWAVLLLLVVGGLHGIAAQQSGSGKQKIQGVVLDAGTGAPVGGARVSLWQKRPPDPNAPPRIMTRTSGLGVEPAEPGTLAIADRNGRFEFDNLDAESFNLSVNRLGYEQQETASIRADSAEARADFVFKLTPTRSVTGTLSGIVRDARTGKPVPGIAVSILRREYTSTGEETLQDEATAQTNDLGQYRIYGIKPGRYRISASGLDRPFWLGNGVHLRYGASFYPRGEDAARASVIDLKAGTERTDIDFTLDRPSFYSIRGRVLDSRTNRPPGRISINVSNLEARSSWSGNSSHYNAETGAFELDDLIPGAYELNARILGENDDPPQASAVVVIGNADVEDVLLKAGGMVQVSGRVVVDGKLPEGSNLQSMNVGIRLVPAPGTARLRGSRAAPSAKINADGTFSLKDVPEGTFRVGIDWMPRGFYLKQAFLDGRDALTTPIPFSQGRNLEVVLTSNGGQLTGTVKSGTLQTVAGAHVVLVPDKARERTDLFARVYADKDGRYSISGVAPGDYKLFAWERLEGYEYFDPEVLKRFDDKGIRVHVAGLSRQTVDPTALLMQVVP